MSSLLAELRWSGAVIDLADGGNLLVKHVPSHLLEPLKANKPAIIEALQSEVFSGEVYATSAMRARIEAILTSISAIASAGVQVDDCKRLTDIWLAIEEAACVDIEKGKALRDKKREEIYLLLEHICSQVCELSGQSLVQAVHEILATPKTEIDASVFA